MLNYNEIRDLYKNADTIKSDHLVIAEWNMNKYSVIERCGLYKRGGDDDKYIFPSNNIIDGKNKILFDDDETKTDSKSQFYSQLPSVFKPNRPEPGIVFVQKHPGAVFSDSVFDIKVSSLSTASARFYPVSENRTYDYYNSGKFLGIDEVDGVKRKMIGVANNRGIISDVNPFVVYEEDVVCNKIVIKVQNHLAIPSSFSIDILIGNTWTQIYNVPRNLDRVENLDAVATSSDDFISGELNLYYQRNGTWSKTLSRLEDFDELISSNPTHFKRIKGIRFRVDSMVPVVAPPLNDKGEKFLNTLKNASLELIEISPRLEADITGYVESFNISSSIGDNTNFGLPVGSVILGTGNITLSNEDGQFLFASILNTYKMLNEDVKFNFYQKVYVPSLDKTFNVPLGVLYSNQWNIGEDYSVSVGLEDGMKYLRQLSSPDFMISSRAALSAIILMILDNVGVTGLEFKKSSDSVTNDHEDIVIKNFFCKKEQTVAEVFEQLAIATQCSMFYDVNGKLNVLTKERLTQDAGINESSGPSDLNQKTDFWFVMDENVISGSDPEYQYINEYTSNVLSLTQDKIDPITDGDITYHYYGPKKQPALYNLSDTNKDLYEKITLDQLTSMNSIAFSNFDYGTTILWQPSQDNAAVLGAANIVKDVLPYRLKDLEPFKSKIYTKENEDELVRQMYKDANTASARQSLILFLDGNEGYTIPDYEGLVLIDNEYIKYRGKLFYVAAINKNNGYQIIFSEEEFYALVGSLDKGESLVFRGLVVDVRFRITEKDDGKYTYKIIGDGRGRFGTDVTRHYSVAEESDGIEPSKRFKLMLGETANYKVPGQLEASTRFDFADKIKYKSAKKFLGSIPKENLSTYLGSLKLSGPKGPRSDIRVVDDLNSASPSGSIVDRLNTINKQTDKDVPGEDFDPFVLLDGERAIYGQKITLPFAPNVVSARMRLYSPRKKISDGREVHQTNSSIAGIGFGINNLGEGYYLEVETATSGKDFTNEQDVNKNLRFYKISLEKHKDKVVYSPKLLLKWSVGAVTTFDTSAQLIKSDNVTLDPVFEIDIRIRQFKNAVRYDVYYGDTKVGDYTEPIGQAVGINSKNICMFVRNDSQALYEYIMAAAKPFEDDPGTYFRGVKQFERKLESGIIPVGKSFLFKDDKDNALFYFNDFARLARQVREYDIRFSSPALTSALLDISDINPKYLIKRYIPTAFGAKLVVANTSGGAITLGSDSDLPLYIVGIALEELSSGTISAKDMFEKSEEDKFRQTDREKNISIFGSQTFTIDSQYIQTIFQARSLMKWVLKYCGRQRIKLSMEIFENPLIELGDKVRIFDKSRGFYKENPNFGDKTFVVSSISRSVNSSGPTMNITIMEVGES